MANDLEHRLLTWLRATGYPFQLHAGRALQTAGWHVNYSRWYRDTQTSKYRELDLQALTGAARPGQAALFFSLVIECKTSAAVPWLALSSRRNGQGPSFLASAPSLMSRRFVQAAEVLEINLPELLPADTLYADSIVAGFVESQPADSGAPNARAKPKDVADPTSPHSALLQTVAAASALDRELFETAISGRPQFATATILLPVVLLRGRLFAFTVADDLSDELREVGAVLAHVPTDNEDNSTLVAVLTEQAAGALWKPMFTSAHEFCAAGLNHAERIANALTMTQRQMVEQL